MNTSKAETIIVTIHMAGSLDEAKRLLRKICYYEGLCVTISAETFIYTGGEEEGMCIGLVNYPRFPSDVTTILSRACSIAERLVVDLCQKSALVVGPTETLWITSEPPGCHVKQ
jgi:hypothetical protein